MKKTFRSLLSIIALLLALSLALSGCDIILPTYDGNSHLESADLESIPAFDGETPYVIINDNIPFFTEEEIVKVSFEEYGDLDGLGRCTIAFACVGVDIMPTEDRGSIGSVKPSGWQTIEYDVVS